jgi:hypothetical protein
LTDSRNDRQRARVRGPQIEQRPARSKRARRREEASEWQRGHANERVRRPETPDGEPDYSDKALIRRVFAEARPIRGSLVALLALSLSAIPLTLLGPVPVKIAVDSVLGDEPVPDVFAAFLPQSIENSDTALLLFVAILQVAVVLLIQDTRPS